MMLYTLSKKVLVNSTHFPVHFTAASIRFLHLTSTLNGRSVDNRSILFQPSLNLQQQQHQEQPIEKSSTYTQLPDDSQFITQHYDELVKFKKYLQTKNPPMTYKDFKQPNDLVMELSNFIEFELKTGIWRFDLPHEIEVEYFMKLLHNLKILLRLNGGYTFILDVLLLNKECFDQIESKKKSKS